ncbi:hypothetical protein D3C71_1453970 [compost metagenome]
MTTDTGLLSSAAPSTRKRSMAAATRARLRSRSSNNKPSSATSTNAAAPTCARCAAVISALTSSNATSCQGPPGSFQLMLRCSTAYTTPLSTTSPASGAKGKAEATPLSKCCPNWPDARMASMRACVSGGATANCHSGRVDANTAPCGDSSTMGRPERLRRRSTVSKPALNITTPMIELDGVSFS